MKALVTSDWHLNGKPRDRYRHQFQIRLQSLLRKHSVDTLLMLGDLTDEKDNHGSVLVNEIVEYMHQLAGQCEKVYILQGNHDCIDPHHAFFAFTKHLPNIIWIGAPKLEVLPGIGTCLFLPHTRDYKHAWEGQSFKGIDLVFTHNTFKGAVAGSGRELDGIPLGIIPKDLTVISGDVHVPQDVGNVTYVGAPYTIDFGDSYQPRVLLLDETNMRTLWCPGPQKCLVTANTINQAKERMQRRGGDLLKLRIAWSNERIDKWPEAKRDLQQWAVDNGITLYGVEPVLDEPTARKAKASTTKTRSDAEVLADYCKSNGINQVLTKVGMDILQGG